MTPRPHRQAAPLEFPLGEPAPFSQAAAAHNAVSLSLRIDTLDALKLRLALHRLLGTKIGIYLLAVDHAQGYTTLELRSTPDDIDALMHTIMSSLPHAEFGPIRRCDNRMVH